MLNMAKKKISQLALFTGAALIFSPLLPASAATPDDSLVMAWNTDSVATFDPAYLGELVGNEIYRNVCDALVELDPYDETKILPRLAASWKVSGDEGGTQVTFQLRDDLKFSDGRPAKAADSVWGWAACYQAQCSQCRRSG